MRRVTITLLTELALLTAAIGVTLSRSPMSVARINGPAGSTLEPLASTDRDATYCQGHETLPAGTSAIRIALSASTGPRVNVVVTSGRHLLTSGEQGSGWTGSVVTVPVRPLSDPASDITVCASFRLRHETVALFGLAAPDALAAHEGRRALPGTMWIEYLRSGESSWASLIPSIVHHMGLGRANAGPGVVFLSLALVIAVAALASTLLVRELR